MMNLNRIQVLVRKYCTAGNHKRYYLYYLLFKQVLCKVYIKKLQRETRTIITECALLNKKVIIVFLGGAINRWHSRKTTILHSVTLISFDTLQIHCRFNIKTFITNIAFSDESFSLYMLIPLKRPFRYWKNIEYE